MFRPAFPGPACFGSMMLLPFKANTDRRRPHGRARFHGRSVGVVAVGTGIDDPLLLPAGHPLAVGADFVYILTGEDNYNAFTVDVNGRYPVFQPPGGLVVSVMGGLNLFRWSFDSEGFSESASDISPAAGGRVDYDLGAVSVFGQAQFVITGDSNGLTVGGGVGFTP